MITVVVWNEGPTSSGADLGYTLADVVGTQKHITDDERMIVASDRRFRAHVERALAGRRVTYLAVRSYLMSRGLTDYQAGQYALWFGSSPEYFGGGSR